MSPQKADRRECRTAATYARVSSQEQAKERFSIPARDKLLRSYAQDHHLEIGAAFTDIETAKPPAEPVLTRWSAPEKEFAMPRPAGGKDRPPILQREFSASVYEVFGR
jgi:hypothetical protein